MDITQVDQDLQQFTPLLCSAPPKALKAHRKLAQNKQLITSMPSVQSDARQLGKGSPASRGAQEEGLGGGNKMGGGVGGIKFQESGPLALRWGRRMKFSFQRSQF